MCESRRIKGYIFWGRIFLKDLIRSGKLLFQEKVRIVSILEELGDNEIQFKSEGVGLR